MTSGYRGVPREIPGAPANISIWARLVAETVNRLNQGKANVTLDATLRASATTTILTDARISADAALVLSPLTANAAAAISTTYVSAQTSGSATLAHANNAQTDRTFRLAILG